MRFARPASLFLWVAVAAYAQCSHTLKYAPVGPVVIYQNGKKLTEGADFTAAKVPGTARCCVVSIANYADGDTISALLMRQTAPAAFALWSTDWVCSGSQGVPPATCQQTCQSDGATGKILGGFVSGADAGRSGAIVLRGGSSGGFGIVVPLVSGSGTGTAPLDAASPPGDLIMWLPPGGTPTNTLGIGTVAVPCPPMLPMIESLHPVCFQTEWK